MDGLYHIHGNDSDSIISEYMKPDEETGMDQVYVSLSHFQNTNNQIVKKFEIPK